MVTEKQSIEISSGVIFPKCLSEESIPEENRPKMSDWEVLQGGKPRIEPYLSDPKTGKLLSVKVIHDYPNIDPSGNGAEIITSLFIAKKWDEQNPYVSMTINGRKVLFPVAQIWAFHGKPCMERSQRVR